MKKIVLFFFCLISFSVFSQTLSTSLSACYALDGTAVEPINNLTGTLSAVTPTVDRFNNPNSSYYFSGATSSYIELPDNPLLKPSNAISFSCWVKTNSATPQYIIFTKNTVSSNFEAYELSITAQFGPCKFRIRKGNGGLTVAADGTTTVIPNTWYHLTGTIDNTTLKLYVNGNLESTVSTVLAFSYASGKRVFLGGSNEPSYNIPFGGTIDNVRFYNRILSGAEVSQLYLTDPSCVASINCTNSFYSISSSTVSESGTSIPNTSTLSPLVLPPLSFGLAIGPAFSFPAPNPTYWTISGGTYWYYNGTAFINTTHVASAPSIGGSKNFIYTKGGGGQVLKYNGTGPATLFATIPALVNSGPDDLVGDDLDNFYHLRTLNPQSLSVYDPLGVLTCTYAITGIPSTFGGSGLSIVGNTVTTRTSSAYYVGIISGSVINFTSTPASFPLPSDFASCPITTLVFSSVINASPNSSISCSNQTITLTANSTSTVVPGNYSWSGPGIITSPTSQSIQVNQPGVYSCTLTSCPIAGSVSSFTVLSGPAPITPTISLTNSLSCASPNATLSVLPNTASHTFFWGGPGPILPSFTSSIITVSVGGIYSVTVTNPITGCSGTQTINVPSSISTLTINSVASNTQVCSPSAAPITLTVTGATNYTWTPIGSTIPGTGSMVIANPTITTTYFITGSTGACTGSTSITISITPTPTLIASGSPTICSSSPTTLSVTGATSYTWMPGSLAGAAVIVSPTVTTNYTITGANGICTSTTSIFLTVVPIPTITASASPTIICQGSTSTLTANGAITYTWQPGNLSGNTVTVSPLTTTIYTVSGTNILGCSSSNTVQLVVNNPMINVSPLSNTICTGNSATVSASGATSYTWNPGSFNTSSIIVTPTITTLYTLISITGVCSSTNTVQINVSSTPTINTSANNPTICSGSSSTLSASGASTYSWNPGAIVGTTVSVSPTVNATYTVNGTSVNGCVNTQTVSLIVNPNPTITAVSNPTSICSGSGASVTLTAGGANTYTWTPGNLTGTNVTVTPTITTTYTVVGTNISGCTSTKTVNIIVAPTPTISVIASPTAICMGNSTTLTVNGAANYTWLPGGFISTSIVVSPTVNTTYTVLGNSGNCNTIKTISVIVQPNPNINIITIPPVICSGGTSILLANGANSYTWNPGSLFSNSIVVSPTVTTSYTVIGTNIFGCRNTAITTLTVNPTPTVTTLASSTMACLGASVNLTSSGALNYIVNPGALTGSLIVVTPIVTTTYTITGLNVFGCTGSNTVTINVGSNPTITTLSSSSVACNGTSLSLTAGGASNYTWMPIGINSSSVVTTATNSINTYTVIGEIGGCISSSTLSVLVIDCSKVFGMTKAASKPVLINNSFYNVTFTITAVNASSLNLTNVSLNENLSIAFPYPSSFTVVNQPVITSQNSSLSIHPLFDGVSEISLTSPTTSTLLANKRDTIVFTVRVDPKGFYGPFYNSVIGFADILNSITVSDSSNNGFSWDPDGDGDPTNNDTITVINLPIINLFVPDGFTPDGDGKNDFFFIKGLNGRSVKLTIFNRWGNKVYEKTDYDNSWNGYVNTTAVALGNNKVPAATYYYIIEFLDGDKETRTGFVVVQY